MRLAIFSQWKWFSLEHNLLWQPSKKDTKILPCVSLCSLLCSRNAWRIPGPNFTQVTQAFEWRFLFCPVLILCICFPEAHNVREVRRLQRTCSSQPPDLWKFTSKAALLKCQASLGFRMRLPMVTELCFAISGFAVITQIKWVCF